MEAYYFTLSPCFLIVTSDCLNFYAVVMGKIVHFLCCLDGKMSV